MTLLSPDERATLFPALLSLLIDREFCSGSWQAVISWAADALVEGIDSPSLRILAGLSTADSDDVRQAAMYLERALGELGMRYPSTEELEREYARRIAHEIVSHKRSPYDGAYRLNDLSLSGRLHADDENEWGRLLDALAHESEFGELSPLAPEGAENAILAAAKRLLEKHENSDCS
jgi:hypothetical protein